MGLSFDEIRSLIQTALPPSEWIEAVYPDHVVTNVEGQRELHRRDYAIKDGAVSLAEAVKVTRQVSYPRVDFSLTIQPQQFAHVTRSGKLFEAQLFPERGYGVTEEELDEIVSGFTGAPILIQHTGTIFDTLGQDERPGWVTRLWRRGKELFGEVKLADWLHRLFGDQAIKVSVGLTGDRPRRLMELSLVPNPRIPDAAILAAYQQFAQAGRGAGAPPQEPPITHMEHPTLSKEDVGFVQGLKKLLGLGDKPADPTEARFSALESKLDQLLAGLSAAPAPTPAAPAAPDFKAQAAQFSGALIQSGKLLPAKKAEFEAGFVAIAPAGEQALKAYTDAYSQAPVSALFAPAIPQTSPDNASQFEADGTYKVQVDVKKMLGGAR